MPGGSRSGKEPNMKFTCNSKDLVSAVQTAIRVMAARSPMEILEGVLLDADENGLTLTASDGNITSVTRVDASVETDGAAVLPGKLFSEVVRKLPEGEITASLSNSFVLTLKSAASRINIAGRSAEEYPRPEESGFDYEIKLPQPLLRDMISQVSFAVPLEDQRVVLTGGFLNMQNGQIDLVGLDGFRMAMRTERISDTEQSAKAIIPCKALDEIAKLMSDDPESNASLRFGKNRVLVENGMTRLYASLIEGEYIDYRRVIPKNFSVSVRIDREQFCDCVERCALMARVSRNNLVRFDVTESGMIMSASSDAGDVREEMEANVEGDGLTIYFNVRYLTEIIRVMSGSEIILKMGTPVSPCVITPAEGDLFTYLVLPVRTNG